MLGETDAYEARTLRNGLGSVVVGMRPEEELPDAALVARPLNNSANGLGHQPLPTIGGTEPVADGAALTEPDRDRPDLDVVQAADRERSLVALLPFAIDRLEPGEVVIVAVRDGHERDEARDVRVM